MDKLLPHISTYRLLIFYHVCNEKGITAAADKLFLSQPTVTAHMKALENSIGAKLFQISRKKMTLTHIGEGLYNYAREIFQQSMAADRFVEISRESNLNIGISSLLVHKVAVAINAMYAISKQRMQSIYLEVRTGESFTLIKELSDLKIDLAVVPNFDFGNDKLSHIRITDGVKLTFYASSSHPIFTKETIDWLDLFDYPLIVGTEDSPMKKILAKKIISEGLHKSPQYYMTSDNFELYKTIVKNGKCISFALWEDIKEDVEKGLLRVLPLPNDICVDIDVIGYQSLFSTALVKEFISCVKAAF